MEANESWAFPLDFGRSHIEAGESNDHCQTQMKVSDRVGTYKSMGCSMLHHTNYSEYNRLLALTMSPPLNQLNSWTTRSPWWVHVNPQASWNQPFWQMSPSNNTPKATKAQPWRKEKVHILNVLKYFPSICDHQQYIMMSPVPSSSSLTESLFFSILDSDVGCDSEAAIWSNFFFQFHFTRVAEQSPLSSFIIIYVYLEPFLHLMGLIVLHPLLQRYFFWWFSHLPFRLPPARSSLLPAVATGKSQRGSSASPLCSRASVYLQTSVSHVLQKSSNIHVLYAKNH